MSKESTTRSVTVDGTEYQLDQLSDKSKIIAGFIQRIDKEALELKYQIDKAMLARKQAIADFNLEVDNNSK